MNPEPLRDVAFTIDPSQFYGLLIVILGSAAAICVTFYFCFRDKR
jgi:hypothetical protein